MADLLYIIGADTSNFVSSMQNAAESVQEFATETESGLGEVTDAMVKASESIQSKLSASLTVATGNFELFGDAIAFNQQKLSAYTTALNSSLSAGFKSSSVEVKAFATEINNTNKTLTELGGNTLSNSMKFQQMRSGLSAMRDGTLAFAIGGQRADMMLMAMGHHITSLVNETGSLGGALKALGSSLGGVGGAILLLTIAYEIYEHSTKKAKETTEDYVKTLDSVRQASLKGQQDGASEITRLQVLYTATQNHALSLKDRNLAYDELERKYPKFFTNAEREKTILGENSKAYMQLANSILAAAMAKAYEEQIGTNSKRDYENVQKINDQLKIQATNQAAINKEVATLQKMYPEMPKDELLTLYGDRLIGYKSNIEAAALAISHLTTDSKKLNEQNIQLATMAGTEEQKSGFKTAGEDSKTDKTKKTKTQLQELEDQLKKLQSQEDDLILHGYVPDMLKPTTLEHTIVQITAMIDKVKELNSEITKGADPNNKTTIHAVQNLSKETPLQNQTIAGDPNVLKNMKAMVKARGEEVHMIMAASVAQSDYNAELKIGQKIGQDLIKTFGEGLMTAFQSAISGTQNFVSAMGHFLEQLIEKLIAAAIAAEVLSILLDATGFGTALGMSASSQSFTGLFSQLAGFGSVSKHADGGIFTRAHVGMFGEAGPEAIVTPKHLQEFANVSGNNSNNMQLEPVVLGPALYLKWKTRSDKFNGRTT